MGTLLFPDHLLLRHRATFAPFRLGLLRPDRFARLSQQRPSLSRSRARPRNHIAVSCADSASPGPVPADYGGWDELVLLEDYYGSGKLDLIREFLVDLGFVDGKHGFLFLLGFFAALVVSKARFSALAVLPVSITVFVVGFSAGTAQVTSASAPSWDFGDEFGDLGTFLRDLEGKMSDLMKGLEEGMESNRLDKRKLREFIEVVECTKARTARAQKLLEESVSGDGLVGKVEGGKKPSQKSIRRRRELGRTVSDLIHFFGDLLQENFTGLRPPKGKDGDIKVEMKQQVISLVDPGLREAPAISSTVPSRPLPNNNLKVQKLEITSGGPEEKLPEKNQVDKMETLQNTRTNAKGRKHTGDIRYSGDVLLCDEELDSLNTSFRSTTRQESYRRMIFKQKYGHTMQNGMKNSSHPITDRTVTENVDFSSEAEASSLFEQTVEIRDTIDFQTHEYGINKLRDKHVSHKINSQTAPDDHDFKVQQGKQYSTCGIEEDTLPDSVLSADAKFSQNVKEASNILKRARELLKANTDEEAVDVMLYESAKLLLEAVALKPMSLLAIGQLANTYLLHGELKLKISRELRALLSRESALFDEKSQNLQLKKLDIHMLSRESVASSLTDVCEECEELLIEAGRKYRMALSIDGNDVRALYNWGLALSFRAQLIADIGPEAAVDADKVYMAAIDKFDAIVSRRNAYAPDDIKRNLVKVPGFFNSRYNLFYLLIFVDQHALYRWGIALQQRSNLRRHHSEDKMKLLQQAKSLFEDVLRVESDNRLVREALSSCLLELRHKERG